VTARAGTPAPERRPRGSVAEPKESPIVSIEWRRPALDDLHPLVRDKLAELGIMRLDGAPDVDAFRALVTWASELIGELTEDQKRLRLSIEVEHELCNLVSTEREHRRKLEHELGLAGDVQRSFVPGAAAMTRRRMALASFYRPAASCGGDWWGVYDLQGDRVLVVIGDVTGHGVVPAMLTGVAKGACDALVRKTPAADMSCAGLLRELNRSIRTAGRPDLNMTCAAAIVDPTARKVTFASASHALPYVVRGARGDATLQQLVATGTPLGASADAVYHNATLDLHEGDTIVWYTDGVLDYENESGEQYGERRFRHLLRSLAAMAPTAVRDAIWRDVFEFAGDATPVDDVAFVVVQLTGQ
jgi:serine phosphatase RsbU (regulator of sigma subunit)